MVASAIGRVRKHCSEIIGLQCDQPLRPLTASIDTRRKIALLEGGRSMRKTISLRLRYVRESAEVTSRVRAI